MPGLIPVLSNSQLDAQEQEASAQQQTQTVTSSLSQHILSLWEKAKTEKQPYEDRMLQNIRQFKNTYEPSKLAAIKAAEGSEVFVPVTNMKCRAAEAWIKEIIFQPGEKPWKIEHTPIPDLPEEVEMKLQQNLQEAIMMFQQQLLMAGAPPEIVQSELERLAVNMQEIYEAQTKQAARQATLKLEDKIDDALTEGRFYEALEQCVHDLCIMPAAILKGPVFRKDKTFQRIQTPEGWINQAVERIIPHYERRNPLDIYPVPGIVNINDGGIIDKITVTPKQLADLKGLPGFNVEEIDKVLNLNNTGGLRNWTRIDSSRQTTEKDSTTSIYNENLIDALEYWDDVKGSILLEWGMDPLEIPDPNAYYPIVAWLIGTSVIKAVLNHHPLGYKPYSKASFLENYDSFWGYSIPDILEDIQGACNAIARAIVNNAAFSSGPMIERNIDRIPQYETKKISPYRIWDATDAQMSGSPAYRFYGINMTADKLLMVYQAFMKQADELSGIPAYSHGDVTVGGAGRTASGLSMLTSNANRGIKAIVANLDSGLIKPTIERQYYLTMETDAIVEEIPDMEIVPKGSLALMEKELQTARMTELLNTTNNPVDLQIIGLKGRRELMMEVAKAHGLDVEKIFGESDVNMLLPQNGMPQEEGEDEEDETEDEGESTNPGNPAKEKNPREVNAKPVKGENGR